MHLEGSSGHRFWRGQFFLKSVGGRLPGVETEEGSGNLWILSNQGSTDCGSDPVTVNGHPHREQSDGKHPGGASSGGSGCYGIHFLSAHDGKWQSLQIYDTK